MNESSKEGQRSASVSEHFRQESLQEVPHGDASGESEVVLEPEVVLDPGQSEVISL